MSQPLIVLNPRDDLEFAGIVQRLLDGHEVTVESMQASLRARYPDAVVRERGLSHEPVVWYVYRDGHWVGSGSGGR